MNSSKIISGPLLKEQLRRFWMIMALPMLVYLLGIIIPLHNASAQHGSNQTRMILDIIAMRHPLVVIFMVLSPFLAVMALYPYHFSRKATGAFYTFPVSKRQLFATNWVLGAVLVLLPILLLSVILLVPIRFNAGYIESWGNVGSMGRWTNIRLPLAFFDQWLNAGDIVNRPGIIFGFFMRMSIGSMFYFAMFMMAVSVSGNRVISILLCAVIPFIPAAVTGMLHLVGDVFVFGMAGGVHLSNALEAALVWFNPVGYVTVIADAGVIHPDGIFEANVNLMAYTIGYIVLTLAFAATAYVSSMKRRQERTGDSVVYYGLKNVLVFILSLVGLVFMANLLAELTNSRVGAHIGGVLGFIIMYFVAQMIAEKALNIFRAKGKQFVYFAGIMLGLFVTTLLVANFGLGFFVNRIPAYGEIVSVHVSDRWLPSRPITDRETIRNTIALHEDILTNRQYFTDARWQTRFAAQPGWVPTFRVEYHLQNGDRVVRQYYVSVDYWNTSIIPLVQSRPVVFATNDFFANINDADNMEVGLTDRTGVPLRLYRSQHDFDGLIEAAIMDFEYANFINTQTDHWAGSRIWLDFTVSTGPNTSRSHGIALPYRPGSEVIAWLQANGFAID